MKDLDTPLDPLVEARTAFAGGNYALARKCALPLAESDDLRTREAAQKLLSQLEPAPVGKYLFLLTALLLVAVTYFAYAK